MTKSSNSTMAVLVCLAFLGGTLVYGSVAQADFARSLGIDFSVLDKWNEPGAQRRAIEGEPRGEPGRIEKPRELTQKEIQKAEDQAQRLVATIREKLSKPGPEASVTWSRTSVTVGGDSGGFFTPPSAAGVFAAIPAGTSGTPATSITPLALRRSAAILARAVNPAESEETAAFLAEEAAQVLAGGSSRVRVDDAAFKWNDRQQKQFRAVLQEAETLYKDIEFAKSVRERVGPELIAIASSVQDGTLSAAEAENKKRNLSDVVEEALKRSREAQRKLGDLTKKIEYIVISGGKS